MEERVIAATRQENDAELDTGLRPRYLGEFVGQSRVKENLAIFVEAARGRSEPLDHVLLHGPPGLGKTTLARIVAAEMGVNCRITSGPALERPGDLASILTALEAGDVLFIDEVHRLPRGVEEILYPALEEFCLDIVLGKGPSARSLRLDLSPFTLVGATTRAGLLTSPLRNRFGIVARLEFYGQEDIEAILERSARLLEITLRKEACKELAARSRGTPRVANRLLKRVRDYAQVRAQGIINREVARQALDLLDVDEKGLDGGDRGLLQTVLDKFDGGPVGLDTLAAALGEEPGTLEEVYEPFLLQQGFLQRTPRGRVATGRAARHLGRGEGRDERVQKEFGGG